MMQLIKYSNIVLDFSRHATENDINIRHKGNEESDEQYSPPRGLIERLPSDQSTQRPEDTRNSIVPVKDSQENEKTTVTEDLAFAEEHRESMAEMRKKILNTLEVVPVKDSQGNEKTTVTEDLAFAEEHRESMVEIRQKILNTLEVVRHTINNHDVFVKYVLQCSEHCNIFVTILYCKFHMVLMHVK
ncbi:Hypothetical predicted protein [Octopus vulgaris]|uniref:Uncharacterized protein n=1 Tax=Octopus vulgaris TaxID=6645 RepID=A0AA36BKD8_OCTVU|nr:Hypothetical predicted protein [Octopus vulgaris]